MIDPAARGAAPLLRSVTKEGDAHVATVPFGLFLELLAARVPAGQELPAAGKGLPLPPLATTATAAPATPVATLPGPATLPLLAAAYPTGLRLEGAGALLANAPPLPIAAAPQSPSPPAPTVPASPKSPAALPITTEPFALPAAPSDLPAVPVGVDVPTVDPAPELPALRDLLATTSDQRPRPPAPVEARAATTPLTAPAGSEMRAASPAAEVATPVLRVVQRDATHFTLRPVVAAADTTGVAPADWIPAATSQPAAHATAPHSAAAPAQATLDMNAPDWPEAFASRVQWLVDHRVGEAHIKLNPPELGAVDVKISLVDDQTFVQLTAATPSARDELSQSLPRLRELLIASGLDVGGASVHGGRDGRHESGGYAAPPSARFDRDPLELGFVEGSPAAPRHAAGRIDVFA